MKRILTFHQISFDGQLVNPAMQSGTLFHTGELGGSQPAASVARVHESEIVRWLFAHPRARELVCKQTDMPADSVHRFCVGRPVLVRPNVKPGDIDWLCIAPGLPHLAVAAEFKRVKATALRDGKDHVNKIRELGHGVVQANHLAKLGIHRTYLAVILEVDGRLRTEENCLFRSVRDDTFQRIYDFPLRDELSPDVGVMFIEIVQPSARSFNLMASVGVCVDRPAQRREQTKSMTARIRQFLSRTESS